MTLPVDFPCFKLNFYFSWYNNNFQIFCLFNHNPIKYLSTHSNIYRYYRKVQVTFQISAFFFMLASSIYLLKYIKTPYVNGICCNMNLYFMRKWDFLIVSWAWKIIFGTIHRRPEGGEHGNVPPPPKSEKIVVEIWCYFPRLYI